MFNFTEFMPHGHCYLWKTDTLLMHVGGDILIFISYMLIPLFIQKFLNGRKDIQNKWVFVLFQLFILFCGFTHLLEIISVWMPMYYVSGVLKVCTGLISIVTVLYLLKIMKRLSEVKNFDNLEKEDRFHLSIILNNLVDGYIIYSASGKILHSYFNSFLTKFESYIVEDDVDQIVCKIFGEALSNLENDKIYKIVLNNSIEFIKVKKQKHFADSIIIFEIETRIKKLESENRRKSELTSLVIDNIPALISFVSSDLKYQLMNKLYGKYWGVSSDDSMNLYVKDVLPEKLYEYARPHIELALKGESVFYEAEYFEDGERITFDVAYLPYLEDGEVLGFVTTAIDTTLKTRNENLLINKNIELEKISKDLENFVFFVSHDLQAPLRHILSFSNMLVKDIDPTPEQKQYVDIINNSCNRARELIEGILKFSSIRDLPILESSLENLFYSFLNVLRKENEDVEINYRLPTGVRLKCAPLYLSLAFENILNNAVRIFKDVNSINKFINIVLIENPNEYIFYFEDNAGGIRPENLGNLFNMFSSFTNVKSSGLGLAIVAKVCELHQARYGVFNNVSNGATFWIAIKK